MRVGSLFSGIGGLDLGLERAGFDVRWQVEADAFRRWILAKHWPDVPKFDDVRTVGVNDLEPVEVIAGGFPCKGTSPAGLRNGLDHEESGLWREFARVVRELRPSYVIVENSSDLVVRGLGTVLSDLHELGFNAEWSVVSACSVGAPHPRRRLFIVAYPQGSYGPNQGSLHARTNPQRTHWQGQPRGSSSTSGGEPRWLPEPAMDRVAVGVPSRVVRPQLEALGNVVLPRVAELVGRRLLERAA